MTGAPVARTLAGLLDEQADANPDNPAAVGVDGRLTYGQWRDRAYRVAGALARSGVRPGDRVALLCDNRVAWLEMAAGTAVLGAVLLPWNTWAKPWDLEFLLDHGRPAVLVSVDRAGNQDFLAHLGEVLPGWWEALPARRLARAPQLREVVVIGDTVPPGAQRYAEWSAGAPGALPDAGTTASDTAMVLYTSGSTARPKAVPLRHGHLIDNGFQIGERIGLGGADRVFLGVPLFWSFGSANALMAAWTHRSALVLQPQFEPERALDLIAEERCTTIYTLPAMTHALLAQPGFTRERIATLHRGLTLGSPAELHLAAETLGVSSICNIYGSTESYGNCAVTPHDTPPDRRAASQGPPLDGVELRIVDPVSSAELPAGEVGEIQVRGRITPGYLDASGRIDRVVDDDGWFATGDLGLLDSAGWLVFSARATEMIKTSGINVAPAEVEEFLSAHPDVAEVAVAGGDDPVRGQQVVAFVRRHEGAASTGEDLRAYCKDRIAGYKVPARVVMVESFPLTGTGKLSRRELSRWATEALADRHDSGTATARG